MASPEFAGSPRSRPFLTSEQREALDAALAQKQDKDKPQKQDRRWMVHRRSKSKDFYDKLDRKSKSGKGLGSVKKAGSGGKFTWGALSESDGVAVLDKSDPNYDSGGDDKHVVYRTKMREEVDIYKTRATSIIDEFFDNGDVNEAASLLCDLELPHFAQFFVKKAITMAMDRRDREREMTAMLLSAFYSTVISPEQMTKGFINLIESVDDLKLDVPDAVDLVSLFVARAVVDDILAPSVVVKLVGYSGESSISEVQEKVQMHLSARHCTERLLRVWGAGAGLNYQDTKDSIVKILYEFTSSHDIEEARRCLRNLGLQFFHHEFVKQAVHMAMENSMHRGAFIELLSTLCHDGEISDGDITKGFQRVASKLDDTVLDNPSAKEQFAEVVEASRAEEPLMPNLLTLESEEQKTESHNGSAATHPHSVQAFKVAAQSCILEYFESSDIDEVADRVLELEDPGLHHILIKHAVRMALDRRDREREMVSVLLAGMYPHVLTGDQLGQGFARLLVSAEDLVLDNPDAAHLISLFLGRIIVDEVLPPSFLTSVLGSMKDDSLGIQIVQSTGLMLSARHASERLLNCWHGGSKDIEQIREDIKTFLKEYLDSQDVKEVAHCLHDLSVPFYHHEVVRRAVEMALDNETALVDMSKLLSHFAKTGIISQTQMKKGFDRMDSMIDDLALDYPKAPQRYETIKAQALKENWT